MVCLPRGCQFSICSTVIDILQLEIVQSRQCDIEFCSHFLEFHTKVFYPLWFQEAAPSNDGYLVPMTTIDGCSPDQTTFDQGFEVFN